VLEVVTMKEIEQIFVVTDALGLVKQNCPPPGYRAAAVPGVP